MKAKQLLAGILSTLLTFGAIVTPALASSPATLALSVTSGDGVRVSASGDPNSTIQLSFYAPGSSSVNMIGFGTTDANGNFNTTVSSGGYSIPAGAPVYITINGFQSPTTIWPNYSSLLNLNQTSVSLSVGQSLNLNGSYSLILAANSHASSIGTAINGTQLALSGLAVGSGTVTVCAASAGCQSINVIVGATSSSQGQITFSQSTVVLNSLQTLNINMFGGASSGYTIKSNSNSTAITPSISGTSNVLTLYGNTTGGVATIVVCSVADNNNCASVYATVLANSSNVLSFNPSSVTLIPGQSQTVTISGGPDNNYYISANTGQGIATVTIAGNVLTLVGGTNAGNTTVSVCSTTVNASCGNLSVTNNVNNTTTNNNGNTISFSQNVVTVGQSQTTNVTVLGGNGTNYLISSNSNPTVATPSIGSASNIISIYGNNQGSTIVTVCSASSGSTCASIYVTVGAFSAPITLSQNNISIFTGQSQLLTVTGGTNNNYVISSNQNPSAVSANISSGSNVLTLVGGYTSGSSSIKICSSTDSNNCATLYVSVNPPAGTAPTNSPAPSAPVTTVVTGVPPSTGGLTLSNGYIFTLLLKLGSTGKEVTELQKRLKTEGLFSATPNGVFGPLTQTALKAFQKKNGIAQAGYTGPATRAALNKYSSL